MPIPSLKLCKLLFSNPFLYNADAKDFKFLEIENGFCRIYRSKVVSVPDC